MKLNQIKVEKKLSITYLYFIKALMLSSLYLIIGEFIVDIVGIVEQ